MMILMLDHELIPILAHYAVSTIRQPPTTLLRKNCTPSCQSAAVHGRHSDRRCGFGWACSQAAVDLGGRFFGGRQVRATFYDEDKFAANDLAPDPVTGE